MNEPSSFRPFDGERLREKLETLRTAFEAKGHPVSANLLPPVEEQDLRRRCAWFPAELPDELVALYAWHEGQADDDAWDEGAPFWFGDHGFSNLQIAQRSYVEMMESYGLEPELKPLLEHSFPLAAFEGAWLVLPCRQQQLLKRQLDTLAGSNWLTPPREEYLDARLCTGR